MKKSSTSSDVVFDNTEKWKTVRNVQVDKYNIMNNVSKKFSNHFTIVHAIHYCIVLNEIIYPINTSKKILFKVLHERHLEIYMCINV